MNSSTSRRPRWGTRLPITRAPSDLKAVCTEVVAELEALHPERQIQLAFDGDLAGKWDAGRVGQMVSNLVRNAIQHGDELPVTVMVKGAANDVSIEVHNKGRSIRPQSSGTLFEPLGHSRDVGADRHSGSSGLGLGLYIAREIAVAHGGAIEVVSSEEGGTTFTARLRR